ncbi:AAA domain-containing protein [Aureibacillus halotolerans]|uniref:AAA domain-containing protein n=1 Tax=Aureibacillus halotolerans TaxID=1508390 RepID=A0A4R6TQU6_9BACI|nr:AAA domain-containing protein [Aureibacillus halotolerans]
MHVTKSVVYLISGPLGVGKSTVSKTLANTMHQCALIEGDLLLHMYHGETEPPWEDRLRLAWLHIAAVTRNLVRDGLDVVIDFVVEDELPWFCDQLSDLDAALHYAVLHADPDIISGRLARRGDSEVFHRSLFLRSKLIASPDNQTFLLDAGSKQPAELAGLILKDARFKINGM